MFINIKSYLCSDTKTHVHIGIRSFGKKDQRSRHSDFLKIVKLQYKYPEIYLCVVICIPFVINSYLYPLVTVFVSTNRMKNIHTFITNHYNPFIKTFNDTWYTRSHQIYEIFLMLLIFFKTLMTSSFINNCNLKTQTQMFMLT